MKKILGIVLLVVGGLGAVLFTGMGQKSVLLPLANLYLRQTLPAEHRVVLTELVPGPGSLRLAGTFDETVRFEARGPVSWWRRRFDLGYRVDGETMVLKGRRYPIHLALNGTIEGRPADLGVRGKGRGFDAALSYRFRWREERMQGVEVRADGARVDQLLTLMGRPPYATGRLTLRVEMPRLDGARSEGKAHFTVRDGRIDPVVLRRDFGIELPRVEGYRLEGDFRLARGLVRGEATLRSPLLNLELRRFRSDTAFRIFKSRYLLSVPELSRLKPLTRVALYGPWQMGGAFYFDRRSRRLQIGGDSPSLEGKSHFFYDAGNLKLRFEKAGIPSLLALLGEPPLVATGRFDAQASLTELNPLSGRYRMAATGSWDREEAARILGSDPGTQLEFTLQSEGTAMQGILDLNATYRNPLASLTLPKLRYEIANGAMEGNYRFRLPELSRLKILQNRGARGSLELEGHLSYLPVKRLFKLDGLSRSLGGESRFVYGGNRLQLTLRNVNGTRLLPLLGAPPILADSRVDGTLKLSDLLHRVGTFSVTATGSVDRQRARTYLEIDPGPGVTLRLKGTGTLRDQRLDSRWSLDSSLAKLRLNRCRVDLRSGACEGEYRLEIPELERLSSLTGRRYHGPFRVGGTIIRNRRLDLRGGGKEWGGRIDYVLKGDLLRFKSDKLQVKALMKMLGYSPLIDGSVSSDLRYNLRTRRGTLRAEMSRARFVRSPLTLIASKMLSYPLEKEWFERVLLTGEIDGPAMLFNLEARSRRLHLTIRKGKIDRDKGTIDALVTLEDRGKRYRLQLRGPLSRPRVIPLATEALTRRVEKELKKHKIDKKIEKAVPKELRDSGNPVSNFIKKLF